MPLELKGVTVSIDAQVYENPVFSPGVLSVAGSNLIGVTGLPIKCRIWDMTNLNLGSVSNVRVTLTGSPDIPMAYNGISLKWESAVNVSNDHIFNGFLEFDVSATIMGSVYTKSFSYPLRARYEVRWMSYSSSINQDGFEVDMSNTPLTTYQVNKCFYELDSIASGGAVSRIINLNGSEPPDTFSGGRNGVGAESSLSSKGFNIIY